MYKNCVKRILDFFIALIGLIVLSPLFIILIILGFIFMSGNPFFVQERPGKNEKIFKLIKFRSMSNKKDKEGKLLPDEVRLNRYGRLLRKTSLDELPELINILKGDMAIVGPRPLLVEYIPLYSAEQHRRHEVLPGLTGYAQVNGRNAISWEERFKLDVWYVDHVSLGVDIGILAKTIGVVLKRDGISSETSATMEAFRGNN